jgi:acetolactate synthase-1/3 small subunit
LFVHFYLIKYKLKDFEKREPGEELIENEYLGKREAVFTM